MRREYFKKYNQEHKKEIKEYQKEYHQKHKKQAKEYYKIYSKKYYIVNKQKILKYITNNKNHIKTKRIEYRYNRPEVFLKASIKHL